MSADREVCHWTEDSDGFWKRSCSGALWAVKDAGTSRKSRLIFCPECGRELVAHPYKDEEETE